MKYYDSTVRKTLLILIGLVVVVFLNQLLYIENFTALNLTVSFSLDIVWAVVLVASIAFFKEYQSGSCSISVWGFLWRCLVAKYSGLILSSIIYMFLPLSLAVPSVEYSIFMYFFAILISVVLAWAFFSVSRLRSFRSLLEIVGGR